ncbi:MAG: 3-isopropylmalate dehydratase large subunit [Patescibacteria group bacterium]
MSRNTLFDKVWASHLVRSLPNGQDQILVGLHLIHEVTSPQAFPMIEERGLKVRFPHRTFATVDHIVPTSADGRQRPLQDPLAEQMLQHLERNCAKHGIKLFNLGDEHQGIVHIIGPELGLTQPGMVIACGDSHTSTHGAFGSIALGIGTTQIASVLATGCLLLEKPKVRRINIDGVLKQGVTAKDVILTIINKLGVKGGIGYAYEYAGPVIEALEMEGRMTICNMSIEGGAQCGYVNPDIKTVNYLKGRPYVPKGGWENTAYRWLEYVSGENAVYDNDVKFNGSDFEPIMTWGVTLDQSIPVNGMIPDDSSKEANEAREYMGLTVGQPLVGVPIDVAFIGSCTNGRITDLREAAAIIKTHGLRVAGNVKALVVPGSEQVRKQAESEGLDKIFSESGWEWRGAGCSMCLAMNPDKLQGRQLCASSSNRNFKGRQGSPTGRTILMSPASVVACATQGKIADIRQILN